MKNELDTNYLRMPKERKIVLSSITITIPVCDKCGFECIDMVQRKKEKLLRLGIGE